MVWVLEAVDWWVTLQSRELTKPVVRVLWAGRL